MRLINAPTAAAMASGLHKLEDDKNVLVIDFGGGSLDISVLCVSEGILDVQASRGDTNLGGRDIDEEIVNYCIAVFMEQHNIDLSDPNVHQLARRRLLRECEAAKIRLSESFATAIRVPSIVANIDLSVQLSRQQLEEMMEPWIAKLRDPLERALEDASMDKDEIDNILLVGGSMRIPAV